MYKIIKKGKVLKYLRNNAFTLCLFAILSIFSYGIYIYPHYATDTYTVMNSTALSAGEIAQFYIENCIKLGRYTYGILRMLITLAAKVIKLNFFHTNLISILFIALTAFVIYYTLFNNESKTSQRKRLLHIFVIATIFINPHYADWFQFSESLPYYTFGLFGVALTCVYCFSSKITLRKFILGCFYLALCIGLYQPLLSHFVLISLILIFKQFVSDQKNQYNMKCLITNVISAMGIYCVSVIIQFVIITLNPNPSSASRVNYKLFNNLKVVASAQKSLWMMEDSGKKTLLFLIVVIISIAVFLFKCKYVLSDFNTKLKIALIGLLFGIAVYVSIFPSHIVAEAWLSQRTTTTFYSFYGFFAILSILVKSTFPAEQNSLIISLSSVVITFFLLCFFIYRTNILGLGMHITNALDAQIARNIDGLVQQYEENTNKVVSNIAIKTDLNPTWSYPDVFCSYDINVRAWCVSWAQAPLYNLYSHAPLKLVEMPEDIYRQYFFEKDWTQYSNEQVLIQNDTVYVMVY